jgi:ATP-dependent Lon protease
LSLHGPKPTCAIKKLPDYIRKGIAIHLAKHCRDVVKIVFK